MAVLLSLTMTQGGSVNHPRSYGFQVADNLRTQILGFQFNLKFSKTVIVASTREEEYIFKVTGQ